ncbi:carbohydrate ABC transporter permease [Paenibacillus ihumii]|uniref:carbohydrate ABC transporter permease n=1 Tax=Paenibacillus ihumii TaxID=687436 RepID=UPI000A440B30|nr:carbohydrate ABC transporter permease [Paenibacillus ihumii]
MGIHESTIQKTRKPKFSVLQLLTHGILVLWAITNVFPFAWVVMNSFRTRQYILTESFRFPTNPTLENYFNAFIKIDIWRAYANSFVVSTSVAALTVLLAGLAAFGLTRYIFRGHSILISVVYGCLMISVYSTIIPVFSLLLKLNLINTLVGLILPVTAGSLAFAMVVLIAYMWGIPRDLEEAAFIDGCNVFQICFKIIFPLSRSAFATVAIFSFLWSYNDLFTQLFILRQKQTWTINRLLNEISSMYGTDYGLMAASITLVVIPVLIVYIFMQKHIIKGLTAGAIKG